MYTRIISQYFKGGNQEGVPGNMYIRTEPENITCDRQEEK